MSMVNPGDFFIEQVLINKQTQFRTKASTKLYILQPYDLFDIMHDPDVFLWPMYIM